MKIKTFEIFSFEKIEKEANEFMEGKNVQYTKFIEMDGYEYFIVAYKENEK